MLRFARSVTLLTFVLVLLLTFPTVTAQSGKFPVGSYESGPFAITFKDGDSYEVVHSSGAGVKGRYKISGDTIELADVEGDYACPDAVGKYTWKVEDEKLLMNLVADPCEGRAQALSMPLTMKK
jgi:hypothetical protein